MSGEEDWEKVEGAEEVASSMKEEVETPNASKEGANDGATDVSLEDETSADKTKQPGESGRDDEEAEAANDIEEEEQNDYVGEDGGDEDEAEEYGDDDEDDEEEDEDAAASVEAEEEEEEEDVEEDEEDEASPKKSSLRRRKNTGVSDPRDDTKGKPRYTPKRTYRQRRSSYTSSTDDSSFFSDSDDDSVGGLPCCGPRCMNFTAEVLAGGATVLIFYIGYKAVELLWYFLLYLLDVNTN